MTRSKYNNKRVTFQGKKFDSIMERNRYIFLLDEQKHGMIQSLRCQVRYELNVPTLVKEADGNPMWKDTHICDYIADFTYTIPYPITFVDGKVGRDRLVTEDVKGVETPVFKLKSKLMKAIHGIQIKIVKSPTSPIA